MIRGVRPNRRDFATFLATTRIFLSSIYFSTMSTVLATPWVPSLRNNALAPCALIAHLVEDAVIPNSRDAEERAWTFAGNRKILLEDAPEAREALLETLTAIWRLSQEEERGVVDEEWQNHLEAWLVRYDPRSSSRLLNIHCPRCDISEYASQRGSNRWEPWCSTLVP